jgi:hypothetical protein
VVIALSSVIGLYLFCNISLFFQVFAVQIKEKEKMYVEKVRKAAILDPSIEVYDRGDQRANCRRVCKSEWNIIYWVLPI